jgi:Fe-S-cluster-containing hydrogenase component 2
MGARSKVEKSAQRKKQQSPSFLSVLVHPERCTGCGACERACLAKRKGRDTPEGPAIKVIRAATDVAWAPLLCSVCSEAVCAKVCPADALSRKRDFGPLTLREDQCASCSSCILSCPFGVLHMGDRNQVPRPCDLCGGSPACVKSCPTGAIECIDVDGARSVGRMRASADRITALLGEAEQPF